MSINIRKHRFSLEFYKHVSVNFNPLQHHKSVTRAREFLQLCEGQKLKITNPKCKVSHNMTYDTTPAYVTFTFLNDEKRSFYFERKLLDMLPKLYIHQSWMKHDYNLVNPDIVNSDEWVTEGIDVDKYIGEE